MKLFIYTPSCNKGEFYKKMGKFFAERIYRSRLPYLVNSPATTWVVIEKDSQIIGFGSFEETNRGIEIGDIYTIKKDTELWEIIANQMLNLIQKLNPSLIYTAIEKEKDYEYFIEQRFFIKRESKKYVFLEKKGVDERDEIAK